MSHIEQVIEQYDVNDEHSKAAKDALLLNGKGSLVGTLITLTDLLVKLEASSQEEPGQDKGGDLEGLPLSRPDKKLLRQFIERQQSSQTDTKSNE